MSSPDEAGNELLLPAQGEGNGGGPRLFSHLDRLNSALDARLAARTLEYRLPGWGAPDGWGMVVRLRALPYDKLSPLTSRRMAALASAFIPAGQRVGDIDPKAELYAACDGLIAACDDIYLVDEHGTRIALRHEHEAPDAPRRFDADTCDGLGLPEPHNAREAVRLIFRNDFQVIAAFDAYIEFVSGAQRDTSEALLGEA